MKEFRELFSDAVEKSGRSVEQIAKALDCTENYVYAMMRGERTAGRKKRAAMIAEYFNINLRDLICSIDYQLAPKHLKKDFEKPERPSLIREESGEHHRSQTQIPLVAYVSAGEPFKCDSGYLESIDLPSSFTTKARHLYYAVRVKGDSMLPFLKNGATLIVRKDSREDIVHHDTVIFRNHDDNCWVKHVHFSEGRLIFKSYNPAYTDIAREKTEVLEMDKVECVLL